MIRRSFFQQIFLPIILLVCLPVILFFAVTMGVVRGAFFQDALSRQMTMTRIYANFIEADKDWTLKEESINNRALEMGKIATEGTPVRISLIRSDGVVLADSEKIPALLGSHDDRPEFRQALLSGTGSSVRFSDTLSEKLLYTALYLPEQKVVVRLAQSVEWIESSLSLINLRVLGIFLVALIFGTVLSIVLSRQLSQKMSDLRMVASAYAQGDFDIRLDFSGSVEAESLSEAMNTMGNLLQKQIHTVTWQKNELSGMLNSMVEAVILLNYRLEVVRMNPAAEKLLNPGSPEEYKGKGFLRIFPSVAACELAEETLKVKQPCEKEIFLEEGDLYFNVYGTYLLREDANPRVLLVMNNITKIKKLEIMRKEFVANVSHELRTPITSVLGYAEILEVEELKDKKRSLKFLKIIVRQSRYLGSLIEDLLTLSQIESGQGRIRKKDIAVEDIVEEIRMICTPSAEKKRSVLQWNIEEGLKIWGHRGLLIQALSNLVENAIKYSPEETSVTITVKQESKSIVFLVLDEGPGIPQGDRERIFERFYRVDKTRSREMGGTGLGLSIAKHVALIHDGSVSVSTGNEETGFGSCFSLDVAACSENKDNCDPFGGC